MCVAVFQYKALTADGKKVQGSVEAPDEFMAMTQIKSNYLIVAELKEEIESKSILAMEIGKPKINQKELSVMCSQFAIILQSGMPIDTCIELISRQVKDKHLKKMLIKSADDVAKGNGVAASFEKNCSFLPATFIETVRAGEESGTLEHSFEALHEYYNKSFKTKQKVKQAMSYPIFVLLVAIVVLAVVMVFVIPSMSSVFDGLDGELPAITTAMIATSEFVIAHIWWMLGSLIAVFVLGKLYIGTEQGKEQWNELLLKVPVLGRIAILSGAGQFANTLATLLASGMNISRAIEITGKVMDNYLLGQEVTAMAVRLEEGRRLGDCMRRAKHFPDPLVEMCSIGEESGELEATLKTIGAYYDNEAQYAIAKAIQKLEPTIMILMALFAGFIVISIYLPMFTMYELM